MVLARTYGNEGGDHTIATTFTDESNFIRTIEQNYRYIHGIGAVDSSSVKKEYYTISNEGTFILKNTEVGLPAQN